MENHTNSTTTISSEVAPSGKSSQSTTKRDPIKRPFSQNSIWNMPIGSNARYVDANLQWENSAVVDVDHFYVLDGDDPLRPLFNIGTWGPGRTTGSRFRNIALPLPDDLIIEDAAADLETPNNAAAFLMPDGRTVVQANPLARDVEGGAVYGFRSADVDLYGEGITGGHAGSGLSSIGGTIRQGELLGDEPIRHALKVNLPASKYLTYAQGANGGVGYRWPATTADSYANPQTYGGQNPGLMMGSLLALPPNATVESLGIETEVGKKLFYAFQNYGAYVADDILANAYAIEMEQGVIEEIEDNYGHKLRGWDSFEAGPLTDDYMRLFTALKIIDNNGPNTVGGGGEPRVPLAPELDSSDSPYQEGTPNEDILSGSDLPDKMKGNGGKDILNGAGESDYLEGGEGDDTLLGEEGHDFLFGDNGRDRLEGGSGNDYVDGGWWHDTLEGGAGDDMLSGWQGDDNIDGGAGYDTLVDSADSDFVLTDSSLTGHGNDTLNSIEKAILKGGDSNNTLDASAFSGAAHLDGGTGNDVVTGGGGDDTLESHVGNDRLTGNGGRDRFILNDRVRLLRSNRPNPINSQNYNPSADYSFSGGNGNAEAGQFKEGFAVITDFDRTQDTIVLDGNLQQYVLAQSPVNELPGTAIYVDMDGNGQQGNADKLVAIVQGQTGLSLEGSYIQIITDISASSNDNGENSGSEPIEIPPTDTPPTDTSPDPAPTDSVPTPDPGAGDNLPDSEIPDNTIPDNNMPENMKPSSNPTQSTGRNPLIQPFSSDSIWNTPIGSNAKYVDAQIGVSKNLAADIDHFFALNGNDPQQDVFAIGGWRNRSTGTRDLGFDLPLPNELLIPDTNEVETPNNSSAMLMPDGETLIQLNATTRARVGGKVNGVKYPFGNRPNETLTGSGALGGHGGSGLSSIGGTLRLGELTGDEPIRHVLKLNLWAKKYLSYDEGFNGGKGYRWPAIKADSYADSNTYGGPVSALTMGSLLAIPPGATPESLGLKTEPAKKLFYALQDYGAYVADDTAWDAHALELESGALQEFEHEYGHTFNDRKSDFFDDVMSLFSSLHVVANNGPDSVGGGGIPRAPLAPEIDTSYVTELQQLMDDPTVEDTFRADFNGDGHQDLLWRNLATGANQVWLQDGAGKQVGGGNILPLTDPNWQIEETSDVDQDGRADIVWENRSTGAQQTWHLDDLRMWVDPDTGKRVARWMKNAAGSPRITMAEPPVDPVPVPEPEPEPNPEPTPTPDPADTIGEYGTFDVSQGWQTVELKNTYLNPVVIVSEPTFSDADPATVRVRNVSSDQIQLRLQEPKYKDGKHPKESVSYLVMEAGDWTLADGTRISAGVHKTKRLTSKGFDTIDLEGFQDTPTVLSQVQSFNGGDWVTTRINQPSAGRFQLAMQEEEARNKGGHLTENVGWVAIEQGTASDGDTLLKGGTTGRQYDHNSGQVQFQEGFEAAPAVIAKLGSFYGPDTANLRLGSISRTGFGVSVQEEQSLDAELGHTTETVSFLALEGASGSLAGVSL
ncbi:MAG: FG-GAP-like repeat-containing protein [Cyanobacteria bacterium P01_F01_bin.53]